MDRIGRLFRWGLVVVVALLIVGGILLLPAGEPREAAQAQACWQAEITEQWDDLDLAGSVLRVSVEGIGGLPVTVRSRGSFETVGFTGTKPEYGPNVAEFAPLSREIYFIEPQGLGLVYEIWLNGRNYTRVDFRPLPCALTPTNTPRPATSTPRPLPAATRQPVASATPLPPPPVQPPPPPVQPPPQPAEPVSLWQGRVVEHITTLDGRHFATVAVRVIGRPAGQQVEIRSDDWTATCTTGTKPEVGPDACEFGALNAGTYRITPQGLGTHLDISLNLKDYVLAEFYYTGPPPQTRWVGSVVENTSGATPTEHSNSAITVIVSGRPWHEVEIRSEGWSTTAQTGHKPEYGPDAAEFGGLRASTYTLIPKGLDTSAEVTVDGWGWAMVRFDEVPAPAPLPPQPVVPPPMDVEPSPTPVPPTPTTRSQPSAAAVEPTPTTQPEPSPTVGAQWRGWVVSNSSEHGELSGISSVVVVRVQNWPGVPVHIHGGGGWTATCITGSKPEYESASCDFGGLWPSTYTLSPEGSDLEVEVKMDGLGTAFVEFSHW